MSDACQHAFVLPGSEGWSLMWLIVDMLGARSCPMIGNSNMDSICDDIPDETSSTQ